MSLELEELPLFPLNTVLLPYQTIPLHIFEERYRTMLKNCLDEDKPFGVLLIREGSEVADPCAEPYLVGTTARVIAHSNLPDGQINIFAVGERRFRVRKIDRSGPFMKGLVEPIVELEWEESPDNNNLVERAKQAFLSYLAILLGRQDIQLKVHFTDDPVALSFAMAACLQISLLDKQRLLELTDTVERMRFIVPLLELQALQQTEILTSRTATDLEEYYSQN